MNNRHGKTNWFDLPARDIHDAMSFYEGLFGWTFARLKDNAIADYWVIQNGQELIGGLRKVEKIITDGIGPIIYITVDDLANTCQRVKDLGGKLSGENVFLNDGRGTFQWFRDREGNLLGLWSS